MIDWLAIFLFSLVVDVGAVLYTRSVQLKHVVIGMGVTGMIAAANWMSIWLVVKQDGNLIIPSVVGHMVGFVLGMVVPLPSGSGKARPTPE